MVTIVTVDNGTTTVEPQVNVSLGDIMGTALGALDAPLANSIRARAQVAGRFEVRWSGSNTANIKLPHRGRILYQNNGNQPLARIAALLDADGDPIETPLFTNYGFVINYPDGPKNDAGEFIPQLVTNLIVGTSTGWQDDNTFVLVGNTGVDRTLFGPYVLNNGEQTATEALLLSRGYDDGRVGFALTPALATWDVETRTFTWPRSILEIADASKFGRIQLEGGSIVVPTANNQVVYLDLSLVNNTLTPATAVKVANAFSGVEEYNSQLRLLAVSGDLAWPINHPPVNGALGGPVTSPTNVFVPSSTGSSGSGISWEKPNNQTLFVYGRNASDTEDMRYGFTEVIDIPNDLHDWRFETWEAGQLTDGVWVKRRSLVVNSEFSTAVQTQQAVDYTNDPDIFIWGGESHSQKKQTSMVIVVDGVRFTNETLPAVGTGNTLNLMYNGFATTERSVTNTDDVVLEGQTQFRITAGKLVTFDNIEWQTTEDAGPVYLSMFPIEIEGFTTIQVDELNYNIADTNVVSRTAVRRPTISFMGDDEIVTMTAIEHTGLVATFVQVRNDGVVPFVKGYFSAGNLSPKTERNAGQREYILSEYTHSSF